MSEGPYRVVQWATGNIGMCSLRAVIEHPNMELVGVYVYSEAKKGRDAGELCGLPPTGVIATGDIEDILALKPDCVLYMADRAEIDVLCRLLESGCNVVATRSEFHGPGGLNPADRELIETACRRGGTSIHSTGSTPGFSSEALPFLLLSMAAPVGLLYDRRVRRHVLAKLAGDDLRPVGFRSRSFVVRSGGDRSNGSRDIRRPDADSGKCHLVAA